MSRTKLSILSYIAIGVMTFGHSAAARLAEERAEVAACKAANPKAYCMSFEEAAPVGGFVAAAMWPLYWSWEAWS